jgi:hypothetical protein
MVEVVEMDDGFGDGWYLGRLIGRERAKSTGLYPSGMISFTDMRETLLILQYTPQAFRDLR